MAPIDDITKLITQAIIDALKNREDEFTKIAEAGGKAAASNTLRDVGSLFNIISGAVGTTLQAASFFFPPLQLLEDAEKAAGKEGIGFGLGYWMGNVAYTSMQPVTLPIQHAIADLAQTEIFDPQTAAQLEAKGILTNAQGRSEAAGGNLSGEHYDKLVDASLIRPELAQLLDLWNKGEISEQNVDDALTRHGVPVFWHAALKSLRRTFLSPADLALAFLRTEIDETVMRAYARVLGVTDADMDVLIGNTGEPPGAMELLEAYRRQFIDQARLERGIRQSRIRNEWVDVVERLRFSPMSTADAVRAVVENYITSDQGAVIAEQNGLTPDHWPILVEAWGRPLSHEQMMTLYHRGQATLDDVRQAMRESDVKNKYIDKAIELGRSLIPERTIVSMVDHGVVTRDRAMQMLSERGYNTADADALIKLGTAQRATSHKTLSKTDVIAMYSDRLLTEREAVSHLAAIGYTDSDAAAILQLADVKSKSSALRQLQRGVQAEVRAAHLTDTQAINELVQAGMDAKQAHELVDLWHLEKRAATRNLTEKQIADAAGAKLITRDEALKRYEGLGLSPADALIVASLYGIAPGQP